MARKKRRYSKWFTDEIWLTCEDFWSLGHGLQGLVLDGCPSITDRKALLFEVACARRVMHLLPSELCRRTVELAEQAADAPGGPWAIVETNAEIRAELDPYGPPPDFLPRPPLDPLMNTALELAASLAQPEQAGARVRYIGSWAAQLAAVASGDPDTDPEHGAQLALLHDVFGNPFRPVTVDPAWLAWNGGTVVNLAQGIYDERAFDRMPILGDALEEAGCTDTTFLEHLRGPGPHARGCWVVDLLLGRE